MLLRHQSIQQKFILVLLPTCLLPALFVLWMMEIGSRASFEESMGWEYSRQASVVAALLDDYFERLHYRFAEEAEQAAQDWEGWRQTHPWNVGFGAVIRYRPEQPPDIGWSGDSPLRNQWPSIESNLLAHLSGMAANQMPAVGEGYLSDHAISLPGSVNPTTVMIYMHRPAASEDRLVFFVDLTERYIARFLETLPQPLIRDFLFYSNKGYAVNRLSDDLFRESAVRVIGSQQINLSKGWLQLEHDQRQFLLGYAITQKMSRSSQAYHGAAVWYTIIPYNAEAFLSQQSRRIWLSLIFGLVATLIMIVVGAFISRQIVSPLQHLRRQADALAQGDLDVQASVPTRDEVGDLADSFNMMASQLRLSYHALEERAEVNRLYADQINTINQLANAIVQALSADRIFEILDEGMARLFDYDAIWIALREPDGKDLRITNIVPQGMITAFEHSRIPLSGSFHGRVIARGTTLLGELSDEAEKSVYEQTLNESEQLKTFLIAPLPARGQLLGTITVASAKQEAYGKHMRSVLASLAQAVAIAIEQTALFQRIQHMANELERKVEIRTDELAQAQQKLIQAEKYFATGRMAGNLAHEINNPLGIIKNYLKLVTVTMSQHGGGRRRSDPSMEHLKIIDEEVNRIARLVGQLLNLHRPVESTVVPVDINAMFESLLSLMANDFERHRIKVNAHFSADLPRPTASPDLLRQLFINLLRNAQDAIEDDGSISVRTSAVAEWNDRSGHDAVRIRISDTGCGIKPEDLSQIFDPFFTTKPSDKGTGLGLCVSYSIVRMYEGTIDVESTPGRGTDFIITLPLRRHEEDGSFMTDQAGNDQAV